MKNYRIKFPVMDQAESLRQFSQAIGGELLHEDLLHISGRMGKGTVQRIQFEPAFSLSAWNLVVYDPVVLEKPAVSGADNTFSIFYLLTPDYCVLKSIGEHLQFNRPGGRSTFLLAESIQADLELSPHHPVQLIHMNATAFWLAQQFQKANLPLETLWDRINGAGSPLILMEPTPASLTLAVNQLFDKVMNGDRNLTQLSAIATMLITEFLEKSLKHHAVAVQGNNDAHFEKIMEAEAILKAHLQKNLPNVGDIAHQVALSESTLKRHFKVVFGKSVYEYYLDKKMQLAKNLLLEKPLSVNETAEILGYEKVSNFIDIFKKHHGYSPGSIRKRGFSSL